MSKVVFVMANYNGKGIVKEALQATLNCSLKDFKVVLVDDNSTDGSFDEVQKAFSESIHEKTLICLQNDKNMGVIETFNKAISFAMENFSPAYIIKQDNDCVPDRNAAEQLVLTAQQNEKAGIVGAKVLKYDSKNRVQFLGQKKKKFFGISFLRTYGADIEGNKVPNEIKDFDIVNGSFMLFKKETFDLLGLFYTGFQKYGFEDFDFSIKVKKLGWKVLVNTNAVARHKISHSETPSRAFYRAYNRILMVFLCFDRFSFIVFSGFLFPYSLYLSITKKRDLVRSLKGHVKGLSDICLKRIKQQDRFIKQYPTGQAAQESLSRSLQAYKLLKANTIVQTVKPYGRNNTAVVFDKLTNITSFNSLKNKVVLTKKDINLFYKAGEALAEFHNQAQKAQNKEIMTHGDLWADNMVVDSSGKIFLLDFARPAMDLGQQKRKEDLHNDIACFLTNVIYKYPLLKIFLRARKSNKDIQASFEKGYRKKAVHKVFDSSIRKHIIIRLQYEKKLLEYKPLLVRIIWKFFLERDIRENVRALSVEYKDGHDYMGSAQRYDKKIYSDNSAESYIWNREKEQMKKILFNRHNSPCLDFACGTGRIIEVLCQYSDEIAGVDISEEMVSLARKKYPLVSFSTGDFQREDPFKEKKFNTITAFRFFLNAEPVLRNKAMEYISGKLTAEGLFIFNNHGNKNSMRKIVSTMSRLTRNRSFHELSHEQILSLVEKNNMELIGVYPVNFFIKTAIKILPKKIVDAINERMCNDQRKRIKAVEIIYVCKRKQDA